MNKLLRRYSFYKILLFLLMLVFVAGFDSCSAKKHTSKTKKEASAKKKKSTKKKKKTSKKKKSSKKRSKPKRSGNKVSFPFK